jgi:hypothetical protein
MHGIRTDKLPAFNLDVLNDKTKGIYEIFK